MARADLREAATDCLAVQLAGLPHLSRSSSLPLLDCLPVPSVLEGRESESVSHSVVSDSLRRHGLCPPGPSVYGGNTGVGSLCLLQGIFPTQGSNAGLLLCRRILYQLSHQLEGKERGKSKHPSSSALCCPGGRALCVPCGDLAPASQKLQKS